MPSAAVTVIAPSTLTASPEPIVNGMSTTLTLTTPTANYFNVTINGVPPTTWTCTTTCTGTLVVSPAVTTTYQSAATDNNNVPYTMPSVVVTGKPAPPATPTRNPNPSTITP